MPTSRMLSPKQSMAEATVHCVCVCISRVLARVLAIIEVYKRMLERPTQHAMLKYPVPRGGTIGRHLQQIPLRTLAAHSASTSFLRALRAVDLNIDHCILLAKCMPTCIAGRKAYSGWMLVPQHQYPPYPAAPALSA